MEDPGEAVGKYPGLLIDRLQDVALQSERDVKGMAKEGATGSLV
jgi:hypothetical protein